MKRTELIEILARWRQEANSSVSSGDQRKALQAKRTSELQQMYDVIAGGENESHSAPDYPQALNSITDTVLAYRPQRKEKRRKHRKSHNR